MYHRRLINKWNTQFIDVREPVINYTPAGVLYTKESGHIGKDETIHGTNNMSSHSMRGIYVLVILNFQPVNNRD